MTHAVEDIILQYTYPRIDAEVSKHRNHLLKAPFCVHPKTGRICVPVDPETIDEFDPELVPTVGQLLRELDAAISDSTGEEHSGPFVLDPQTDPFDRSLRLRLGKNLIEALC
jgi:DNA primase small subunit